MVKGKENGDGFAKKKIIWKSPQLKIKRTFLFKP